MTYQLHPAAKMSTLYKEPATKRQLPCCSAKDMRSLHPEGNYHILGEIGGRGQAANGELLLLPDGRTLPIGARGGIKRPFDWIIGYIPVGEDTYIAAIRSILPPCFHALQRRLTPQHSTTETRRHGK